MGAVSEHEVLVVLADSEFKFDAEALSFDPALPRVVEALQCDKSGLGHALFLVAEFVAGRQVWLVSAETPELAARSVLDRLKALVFSIDLWPKAQVRVTFLHDQFASLPRQLLLALCVTPGVTVQFEDVHGARNLFGPLLSPRIAPLVLPTSAGESESGE